MSAVWVKDTVNGTGYYQISTVQRVYAAQWAQDPTYTPDADNKYYIWIIQGPATTRVKGPYPDLVTAQSTLDNAISTSLGGSL